MSVASTLNKKVDLEEKDYFIEPLALFWVTEWPTFDAFTVTLRRSLFTEVQRWFFLFPAMQSSSLEKSSFHSGKTSKDIDNHSIANESSKSTEVRVFTNLVFSASAVIGRECDVFL